MNAFHVPIVGIIANLEEAQPTPKKMQIQKLDIELETRPQKQTLQWWTHWPSPLPKFQVPTPIRLTQL
jgi:hypothetical protein